MILDLRWRLVDRERTLAHQRSTPVHHHKHHLHSQMSAFPQKLSLAPYWRLEQLDDFLVPVLTHHLYPFRL
jgi:hypothetical protein